MRFMVQDDGMDRVASHIVIHFVYLSIDGDFLNRTVFQDFHLKLGIEYIVYCCEISR